MKRRLAEIGARRRRRGSFSMMKSLPVSTVETPVAAAKVSLPEQFLEGVTHDLRGPMATITMAAELLLKSAYLDEQQTALLGSIARSGARMVGMISQLATFTEAHVGPGLLLDPEPCDLGELCRSLLPAVEGRPVAVKCTVEGATAVSCDAARVSQALGSIIENAVAHAAPGSAVAVAVTGREHDVTIAVSNRGEAIAGGTRIFDPRFRTAQKFKPCHLGLGLHVAREVARAHGGDIDLHCEDGLTTFTLHLPRGTTVTP